MTIWPMRISHFLLKAKNAYWEYAIFIVFPLQQWLHEFASVLRCTHVACHFIYVESSPAAEFWFYILIFLYSETLLHICWHSLPNVYFATGERNIEYVWF
jgi:hypothetical protein